jgi:ketosteroid isomerase-like protein
MKRFSSGLVLILCAAPLALPAASQAGLADQVRAAERAFAKSMADRDHAAFVSHLAEEAVFFGSQGVSRGRAAVAEAWKPLFEGAKAPFSWEPERVEVLDSGTLGYSSGPVRDPAGKTIGTYNSVWRKEADGTWKIVFDCGCPPCAGQQPPGAADPSE